MLGLNWKSTLLFAFAGAIVLGPAVLAQEKGTGPSPILSNTQAAGGMDAWRRVDELFLAVPEMFDTPPRVFLNR